MSVLDLFAGPGGWDIAAMTLGMDVLGIEFETSACRTREAAGLRTLQADVAALDPYDFDPCVGLIASPPCQAFSMAGKGAGRRALSAYQEAVYEMGMGGSTDIAKLDVECEDPRGHLVLEPLRWALALLPEWVALEQVPPVLPVWEATAEALRNNGYLTWTGLLSSERFGVPQTRQRAFMLARFGEAVSPPPATHQRYVPPRRADEQEMSLFEAPASERIVLAEDRDLLPWMSMAEALDWGMIGRINTRGNRKTPGGNDFHTDRPSWTLTEKTRSWIRFRASAAERDLDEPAPAITGGHDHNERLWVEARPATTVNGDPRISEPGHHDSGVSGSQQANAVRVSLAEALVLQSFPVDYPVQGTKTKQFEQVGNAVPPFLARAVLCAVQERPA